MHASLVRVQVRIFASLSVSFAGSSFASSATQAMLLVVLAGLALQAPPLARLSVTRAVTARAVTARAVTAPSRTPDAQMVLPKAVAILPFIPWIFVITVNNLPTDLRLRIQKSPLLQSGATMRTMKREPPKIRGRRLTKDVEQITQRFKKQYAAKELELLWAALLRCYGSPDLALAAVRSNPQIINPSYSFCNTMLESRRILLNVLSEQEALDVMVANPAVLQCGPTLESLGPAEIKAFASLRAAGNALIAEEARTAVLGAFLLVFALPVVLTQNPELAADSELLGASKLLAGVVGAPVFLGAILYLLRAGGG